MTPFAWIEPRTIEQASAALRSAPAGHAVLKAGGVDLLDRLKEGIDRPARLINLRRVADGQLAEVRLVAGRDGSRDQVHVGALVTLSQVEQTEILRQRFPALISAAAGIATPQIRQLATVGGNLLQRPRCWYFRSHLHPCKKKGGSVCFAQTGENDQHAVFDNQVCAMVHPSSLATPLMALDASAEVAGGAGVRVMPLASLFVSPSQAGVSLLSEHSLRPDEVLSTILLPLPLKQERCVYLGLKHKRSFDWPLVEVAVHLRLGDAPGRLSGARIVLGAVAPTPRRAEEAEEALLKLARIDDAGLARVGQAALTAARPLSGNGYKLSLLAVAVRRAVRQALAALPERGG